MTPPEPAGRRGVRRPRTATRFLAPSLALVPLLAPRAALAHGFGQRYGLPVPLWLWTAAAAAAVVLSFVVLGLFLTERPGARREVRIDLLRYPIGRLLAHSQVRVVARVVAVALLLLLVLAGLMGDPSPTRNLVPTALWVGWWVGFAYLSALLGNLWAAVNPVAALFRLVERRLGARRATLPYPGWLGAWPAVVLFFAFAWIELIFTGRSSPRELAYLICAYALFTWTGMTVFGRATWLLRADPFGAAFGVLARFSPTEIRVSDPEACRRCPRPCARPDGACLDCEACFDRARPDRRAFNLRPYAVGLLRTEDVSVSTVAFVLLLLATVTFDGFTSTPAWVSLESTLYARLLPLGDARLTVIGTLGLVAFPALLVAVYLAFARLMARAAGDRLSTWRVARLFVLSLVPIAIAYHLAHYFTYLVIQGQLLIRLASDPLGAGWNLFGTARYRPNVDLIGARFVWYLAVAAIVLGHVLAVYVAHAVALREYPDRRAALRSQIPMLVLMVSYTIVSLWIIAQPIVETG